MAVARCVLTTLALSLVGSLGGCGSAGSQGGADASAQPGSPDASAPGPDGAANRPDAGGSADAGPDVPDAGTGDYVVAPEVSCAPTGDACALPAAETGIFASYRKDHYLDGWAAVEYPDPPVDGGRVHIAAMAAASGNVQRVLIDGVDADSIYQENPAQTPAFEWYHVWPRKLTAGQPVWVAFHSRDGAWDGKTSAEIVVETGQGVAVSGTFPVARTPVPLTYVTTTDDRAAFVVHLQNTDPVAHTATRVLLGGRDVTDVACIPDATIQPGEAVMWTIPLCEPAVPGEAWTVVVELDGAPAAVGVGRVLRPRFPVEAWNNTSECPFPGGNEGNMNSMLEAGFDTLYTHGGVCNECGCDSYTLLNETLPATPTLHTFATSDMLLDLPELTDTSRIMAGATGDESDGEIYDDNGVPNAAKKARLSWRIWNRYPEITTFNGAKTQKHIGTFAGKADIQGIDLYVAACAPHITPWPNHPPLHGAYDYLRNARNNHMPLPTWQYAQGLAPTWNQDPVFGGDEWHVQPDPQEILIQAMSVVAAGGKGLMWFQSNQEEAEHAPERWAAIAQANYTIRPVRPELRVGDITGMIEFDEQKLIAEMIRSQDVLIVPVINIDVDNAVDDIKCNTALLTGDFPHWTVKDQSAALRVRVPRDFGVVDAFEVTPAGVVDLAGVTASGRELHISGLALSNQTPVRLLVFAASGEARARIAARIGQ